MIDPDDLIERCKNGDATAYTILYNENCVAVYNSILRLIDHTGEAEDILQESFVAAFQGIGDYRDIGAFRAWVKKIALNKSIDLIRKRKLRLVEFSSEMLDDQDEEEIVDEEKFTFTMEAVDAAIASLPANYSKIFKLYAIEHLPHAEIARILGIEHGAVRTQYHRAKQKILNILKHRSYVEE